MVDAPSKEIKAHVVSNLAKGLAFFQLEEIVEFEVVGCY